MEFGFTREEEDFRRKVKGIIAESPPEKFPLQAEDEGLLGGWSDEFNRFMGRQGWVSLTWPKEYGGGERSITELMILREELMTAKAPLYGTYVAHITGHEIIDSDNEELKKELLPGMARGEVTFWLSLSEPGSGSDLLSLQTTAVEERDCYVLRGQKMWNTYGHLAGFAKVLARTDPSAPRHKGLSMFLVDKTLPGFRVQPLRVMSGDSHFNEVFLDDVRVPKRYLLGKKNEGFYHLLKSLDGDRFWCLFTLPAYGKRIINEVVRFCRNKRRDGAVLSTNPSVRNALAESAIELEGCRLLMYHVGWLMQRNQPYGREMLLAKLLADEMVPRLANKCMTIMGLDALSADSEWASLSAWLRRAYLVTRGRTLGGGTLELTRNTIATRGLGLPDSF
ncbi:MAG: acyl-CoA dehydrogenase family protein [Chloroflexi bacterium]|nr:acyl-CoA dehydrogenase family protein [Chloroflexota bacterium]